MSHPRLGSRTREGASPQSDSPWYHRMPATGCAVGCGLIDAHAGALGVLGGLKGLRGGAFDVFGVNDLGDPQIDLGEVIDADVCVRGVF